MFHLECLVSLTCHVRKLRGGSQPILAKASDGHLYVVKFANNLQGRNLLFNEAIGSELYDACRLPVSTWKPLLITEQFIDENEKCWIETPEGLLRPQSGLCFGSRYLGANGDRLFEILPGSAFGRVQNLKDFWLAWLIDICAGHTDSRGAAFVEQNDGRFKAVFIDHGHMFAGPNGDRRDHFRASAYLDMRIYEPISVNLLQNLADTCFRLNVERLWTKINALPQEWITHSALQAFTSCLDTLGSTRMVKGVLETIAEFAQHPDRHESSEPQSERCPSASVLRLGIQSARHGRIVAA